jgi:hypothetical protein
MLQPVWGEAGGAPALLGTWQRWGRGEGLLLDAAHVRQAVREHMGLRICRFWRRRTIHHMLRSMVA